MAGRAFPLMVSRVTSALAVLLTVLLATSVAPRQAAGQQVQVKPWFFLIVDTSGSMGISLSSGNSCGYAANRMGAARCAIRNILDSTGDAEFGLLQFRHRCEPGCADQNNIGSSSRECDPDTQNLEPINPNSAVVREWVDDTCNPLPSGSTCSSSSSFGNGDVTSIGIQRELYAVGFTPLGASLDAAREYLSGNISGKPAPSLTDSFAGCRPINVILLTDGDETCGGNPNAAATALQTTRLPVAAGGTVTVTVNTYVIGFGITPGDANIEGIATAGGTDAPGPNRGFYAADEAELSAALNQIIVDSQVRELCNGIDDDCDNLIDEDNPKFCDVNGIRTANPQVMNSSGAMVDQGSLDPRLAACNSSPCAAVAGEQGNALCAQPEWSSSSTCSPSNILCESPGEACNVEDDDCDGRVDENAPRLPESAEQCNDGADNDCDGLIDEDCANCTPETCDGQDNDCDGNVDEITRPCGLNVGECSAGVEQCTNGTWGACSGNGPTTEICDGLDNDCDGVIDGITRACGISTGECQPGVEICTDGTYGSCVGDVGPSAEVCDTLDNDCDPNTPDGDADPRVGQPCGTSLGVCMEGTLACVGGNVVCQGDTSGTSETCDGLDNDCDGNVDEDTAANDSRIGVACAVDSNGTVITGPSASVQGECRLGTSVCVGGAPECPDYVGPTPELCDDRDRDCDGNTTNGVANTDPRIGDTCGSIVGACAPGGVFECINENPVCSAPIVPGQNPETCNGIDDDCDGNIDENNPGGGSACDPSGLGNTGECSTGVEACVGGTLVCQGAVGPNRDVCDTKDNDCDGRVDEDDPLAGGECGIDVGECQKGQFQCVNGSLTCQGDVGPGVEVCDGLDNDCDGNIDNNAQGVGARCDCTDDNSCGMGEAAPTSCRRSTNPSDPNSTADLLCGACKFGSLACVSGTLTCAGYVGPQDELCNGRDDDCDDPCLRVDTDNDGFFDAFNCPSTCPANDPDCLSKIDEGVDTTDPQLGMQCGDLDTGVCERGTQSCMDGRYVCVGEVKPSVEICDGLDNDCDGVIDDGIPIGDPCGQTDVGECELGRNVCDETQGQLVCEGEVGPTMEICDSLDNDCNGLVDDGIMLAGECGTDEGECSPGQLTCTDGMEVCVGEVPPQPEICDCKDNDCDGEIDEETGAGAGGLCGEGAACVMCQCARPCADEFEFTTRCPTGRVPIDQDDGSCFCVGQLCEPTECEQETQTSDGGEVLCAPESATVGTCQCINNECTFRCAGQVCESGLICDAVDGRCKVQSCLLPQFACGDGERCDPTVNDCVTDECATADCDGPCREGECFDTCNVEPPCDDDQVCRDGLCRDDPCDGVVCSGGQVCDDEGECVDAGECVASGCPDGFVCDPLGGECEPDPCLATTCPAGEACEDGQCIAQCPSDEVPCDGVCIDPMTSRVYCGASNVCAGGDAGEQCEEAEVCVRGECRSDCPDGLLKCDQKCIDPKTDRAFCGATGDCADENAGSVCFALQECVDGTCESAEPDNGGQIGGLEEPSDPRKLVLGTGGSACACRVPGQPERAPTSGAWAFGVGLLGVVTLRLRRRRRGALGAAGRGRGKLLPALLGALLALFFGGCSVEPFCVNCEDQDNLTIGPADPGDPGNTPGLDAGGNSGNGNGSADGGGGSGGSGGNSGQGDGGMGTGSGGGDSGMPAQCRDAELCNGIDDDCDGTVDEDADTDAVDIDTDSDPNNCGGCGIRCALTGAFASCESGTCVIDSCDVGVVDLDGAANNGCEYRCTKRADTDDECNFRDDDCDGETDEDVDFEGDPTNCGSCGFRCGFPRAANGADCESAKCVLDSSQCDDGYYDINGIDGDGCEYRCTPDPSGKESCNRADDDCDGKIDEDVDTDDDRVGVDCGSDVGACQAGTTVCGTGADAGRVICQGAVEATTEVCDTVDNDCDGSTDEADTQLGNACGNSLGQCQAGAFVCNNGQIECMGGVGPAPNEICDGLDNDCDGKFDENPLDVGSPCSTLSGSLDLSPPASMGTCALGVAQCQNGTLACVGEIPPGLELCDGLDNDCDGSTADDGDDEAFLGAACGSNQGECSPGTQVCDSSQRQLVCNGGATGSAELCDGKDNDCDGNYDEGVATTDARVGVDCIQDSNGNAVVGAGATVQGECQLGTSVCSGGGTVVCPNYVGPTNELCDALDHDCDGSPVANLNDTRIGTACPGNATGLCDPGTYTCDTAGRSLRCTGVVTPQPELCDGQDNDCDGIADDGEDEPTLGQACGNGTGDCQQGTRACVGGGLQCVNSTGPTLEVCDGQDNDCDGSSDEGFQLDTDVNNCGQCGRSCSFANAIAQCSNGTCGIAACQPTYFGNDCSIGPCQFNGAETCNGADDDCDGNTDEGLTPPSCVCAGATSSCQGASGFVCSQDPTTEVCNGADDDCDGSTDEGFSVGASCSAPGIGACATVGTQQCDPSDPASTRCEDSNGSPVTTGSPGQETCDAEDDDCDGNVDEICGASGSDANCVTDEWVALQGGGEIYRYEASRPDANATGSGSNESRACSVPNRLPWTNVTYADAVAACTAAGGRLCTEAEWEQACMDVSSGSCTWPYPSSCDTYSTNRCNGADYTDANYPTVQPTAQSGAAGQCYISYDGSTARRIYGMSGNVKEYVQARGSGAIPVRGGAHNNLSNGLTCAFDFPVWPSNSPFPNVGFRCCR